ncbi:hypothetical protein B0H66DRAFT_87073 [Apodospora peruviana]|uniref:Secreted protein n=1 Tax=Apodospora peruviana TaxID=516989 RepID=A0AAE0MFY4_9PEZI|nr:hypothetical protein B0H66DRAFT_87073 [Apodospora peruviana]
MLRCLLLSISVATLANHKHIYRPSSTPHTCSPELDCRAGRVPIGSGVHQDASPRSSGSAVPVLPHGGEAQLESLSCRF